MANYPEKIRLVVRYAPFHEGSSGAVRIPEAEDARQFWERSISSTRTNRSGHSTTGVPGQDLATASASRARRERLRWTWPTRASRRHRAGLGRRPGLTCARRRAIRQRQAARALRRKAARGSHRGRGPRPVSD
jgi:hypothetical protein